MTDGHEEPSLPPYDKRCQRRLSHWYRCDKRGMYWSIDGTWTCGGSHIYEEMIVGEPPIRDR